MYIKIYFNDKSIYLCDELDKELKEILHHPDAIFIDELSAPAIKSLLQEITKPAFHAGVFLYSNLENLKKAFFKNFTLIEAAGGIIENGQKELLFIYRLEKWDLPKGKVEKGEGLQTCAIREIEEETGAINLIIHNKIGETYHTYTAFGKHFLKTTHWYYLTCPTEQNLVPQTEEDIAAIKWVKIKKIEEPLSDTYPSIKDILAIFLSNKKVK